MFTGIVACQGRVTRRAQRGSGLTLTIEAPSIAQELRIGDSVSVSGCCLTAVTVENGCFTLELVPETLSRTTLGELQVGDQVNLELALRASDRLGGHFVQGHVDGVGRLVSKKSHSDGSTWVRVSLKDDLCRYVVEKGSIAVDGVSLTVAGIETDGFSFAMIPHTAVVTTLGAKNPGDGVHIEVDLLAKYVERMYGGTSAKVRATDFCQTEA